MSHTRRSVLKAVGAAGTATVLPLGSVAADGECDVVVDEWEEGWTWAGGIGVLDGQTESDPFFTRGYENVDLEGRRLHVTVTWGPRNTDEYVLGDNVSDDVGGSPIEVHARVQQNVGIWETVAIGQGETGETGEDKIEFDLVDGEEGPGTSTEAIIEDDRQYRIVYDAQNAPGLFMRGEAEFEAFDPEC